MERMSADLGSELTETDVTTADVVEPPQPRSRRLTAGIGYVVVGIFCALAFGVGSGATYARLRLTQPGDTISVPVLKLPATVVGIAAGAIIVVLGLAELRGLFGRATRRWIAAVVVLLAIFAFLVWAITGGRGGTMDLTGLLSNTLLYAVPLVLGAMGGIVSERSGVINVAIEGQMLMAAFTSALVASIAGNLYFGVLGAIVIGALVGMLLAVFAMRYLVNQVVLGVVINTLILGLTNYLSTTLMQSESDIAKFNSATFLKSKAIPGLSDIPVIGPVCFDQNVLVYLTYVVVIAVHVALFRTRWGLRTRSVGEHPRAADTVGINVNRLRFWNTALAGAIAGLAGAFVCLGTVGSFTQNMTAGRGYIALAVVIFGAWRPLRAVGAALLFAFCSALKDLLPNITLPVSIPSQFIGMLPYVVTIVVVAGFIGRVRAPAADGVPYVKD
jgi:general nucleoside transport system permease protein